MDKIKFIQIAVIPARFEGESAIIIGLDSLGKVWVQGEKLIGTSNVEGWKQLSMNALGMLN